MKNRLTHYIGAGGKAISVAGVYAPRLTDKVMEATLFDLKKSDCPSPAPRQDGLYGPLSISKSPGNEII